MESILGNEFGPAEERHLKRIRVDLTRVRTLYWQAWLWGAYRSSRDCWLVRNLTMKHGPREKESPWNQEPYWDRNETPIFLQRGSLIKCAFIRGSSRDIVLDRICFDAYRLKLPFRILNTAYQPNPSKERALWIQYWILSFLNPHFQYSTKLNYFYLCKILSYKIGLLKIPHFSFHH